MADQDVVASTRREPWNKGRLLGQKRPLRPKDVCGIRVRLQIGGLERDLALFNLAIDSKLRKRGLVEGEGLEDNLLQFGLGAHLRLQSTAHSSPVTIAAWRGQRICGIKISTTTTSHAIVETRHVADHASIDVFMRVWPYLHSQVMRLR